jgi:hypothetical protein
MSHYSEQREQQANEKTPDGLGQHESGAKLDAGKTRMSLVMGGFAKALTKVGEVGTFGANKYTDNGWRDVNNGTERYMDALYRHLLKFSQGERYDSDSGLEHLAHAAWNALAILELSSKDKQSLADALALYSEEELLEDYEELKVWEGIEDDEHTTYLDSRDIEKPDKIKGLCAPSCYNSEWDAL